MLRIGQASSDSCRAFVGIVAAIAFALFSMVLWPFFQIEVVGATGRTERGVGLALTRTTAPPCACSPFVTVVFGPTVPSDATMSSQSDANCFAWAEFVALNWPVDQSAGFGDPGDVAPVQWQTFMPLQLLFPPGGTEPPAWGALPPVPANCQKQLNASAAGREFLASHMRPMLLSAASKFSINASPSSFPSISGQAAPLNQPNWLGAQNGTNVWYEVRINKDEYQYIVDNGLYNANNQATWIAQNKPIVLPKGKKGGIVGSIELKAAWMEVPDPADKRWNRYKISRGIVIDPSTNVCRVVTLALVGLHIIHKTSNQPQWVWATFEHVDNVPSPTNANGPFSFSSGNCQPRSLVVPKNCLPKGTNSPVTVGCTPNVAPPYYLCAGSPGPVPIQVSRVTPLDNDAQQTNQTLQRAIAAAYPNSIWQYYQLINVVWSTSKPPDPTVPPTVPLNPTGLLPPIPVANTTLETYVQAKSCTDCHRSATIAKTAGNPNPSWASDFSFAFGTATAP